MPVNATCGKCSSRYAVPDHLAGKRVRCKKCGGAVAVPAGEDEWDFAEVEDTTPTMPASRPARAAMPKKRRKPFPTGLTVALGGGAVALIGLIALVAIVDWDKALGAIGMSRDERAARGMIAVIEKMADTLATVKDGETAKVASPRLKALGEEMAALVREDSSHWKERQEKFEKVKAEIEGLPPAEKVRRLEEFLAERKRAQEKYEPRRKAATERMNAELNRIRGIDAARPEIQTAMASFRDAVLSASSQANRERLDAMAQDFAARPPGAPFTPPGAPAGFEAAQRAAREAQQRFAAQNQQQMASSGAPGTVTFVITGAPESADVMQRLKDLTGAANISGKGGGGNWRYVASPVTGDVKGIAGRVDFGEVTEADEAKRSITIRWTAAVEEAKPKVNPVPPPVREPLPPPAPPSSGGFDV